MSKSVSLFLKIFILVAILLVFLLAILNTVMYHVLQMDDDKYGRIRTSRDTEEQTWSDWHYNGVKYSVAPGLSLWYTSYEECTEENGFKLISWVWNFPFLCRIKTFADSVEYPHYIYCPYHASKRVVRVSENFDYMDEEYTIYQEDSEGESIQTDTDLSFKLKDVYYPDKSIERGYNTDPIGNFSSKSKSFERLAFEGDILLIDDEYYVDLIYNGVFDPEQTYKAKPEFIELLKKAGILNSDS